MVAKDPSMLPNDDKKSIAPDENVIFGDICNMLKKWGRNAFCLRVAHVSLIIIATVSSVIVASTVDSDLDYYSWLAAPAALLAAISAALFAGLDLGSKSNNVRTAWRKLNAAIMKYRVGDIGIESLIECYEKGEELVGDVKVSLQGQ
jgi:hypothetical protein